MIGSLPRNGGDIGRVWLDERSISCSTSTNNMLDSSLWRCNRVWKSVFTNSEEQAMFEIESVELLSNYDIFV